MTSDRAGFVPQLQMRSALRARVWLSVKAPVVRIVIFRRTFRAHLEYSHRGARTIIRQRFDNREAGPAISAISKRVAITAIAGIENLPLTFTTCGDVRQNQRGLCSVRAFANFELVIRNGIDEAMLEALDKRDRRLFPLDAQQKLLQNFRFSLGLDKHALGVVDDPALEVHLVRQTVDERAESDALHGASDHDPYALELAASHSFRLGAIITCVCAARPTPIIAPPTLKQPFMRRFRVVNSFPYDVEVTVRSRSLCRNPFICGDGSDATSVRGLHRCPGARRQGCHVSGYHRRREGRLRPG